MKPNQVRQLEKLYQRRLPPERLVTPEFARNLTELSAETRRQVGVLLDRRGGVDYVIAGGPNHIELPDIKRFRGGQRRFRGLRCVHTHLDGSGLSRDDLTDLSLLRLDTISALEVTSGGLPGRIHTAHLSPDFQTGREVDPERFWRLLPPVDVHRLELDFQAFIRDLEDEFIAKTPAQWRQASGEKAILMGVTTGSVEEEWGRVAELTELAVSAGVTVLDSFVQRRPRLDVRFLMGQGKLREVIIRSMQLGATMLVFNRNLSPTQIRSVCRETDMKVIDRTQLILDIFARRARSQEGKIQVELAQLKYLMPRLVEYDDSLSRLTGGIGGRGPGETTLEVNRRRVKDKIALLEKKIQGIRRARAQRRRWRRRAETPLVSIVGYTNVGKSTLFNALTRSEVLVEDKLFATLDPISRRMRLPWPTDIILADTVGFIRDLPPDLRDAFKATLEEIEEAALLIHLADVASPECEQQIREVEEVLTELDLADIPRLLVLNKTDRLTPEERDFAARRFEAPQVSATNGEGLVELVKAICRRIGQEPAKRAGSDLPVTMEG